MNDPTIIARFRPELPLHTDFAHPDWGYAEHLTINLNWRGEEAPPQLHTAVMLLWSGEELLFGFECAYTELDIDQEFDLDQERYALWDRDVCEAFIRSPLEPDERIYKEFEVAPTGQWCDLKIDRSQMTRDWEWRSGMRTAGEIDSSKNVWRAAMAIPFDAFGIRPQAGEVWKANLFRIGRYHGQRHYLALSPTLTEVPNFHLPEKFIDLRFVE